MTIAFVFTILISIFTLVQNIDISKTIPIPYDFGTIDPTTPVPAQTILLCPTNPASYPNPSPSDLFYGCIECDLNWNCVTCSGNLKVIQNRCVDCSFFFSNCQDCSIIKNVPKCSKCLPGYGLFNNSCFPCNNPSCSNCDGNLSLCNQCKTLGVYSINSTLCFPCSQKCKNCDQIGCISCFEGYYVHTSGLCQKCQRDNCQKCRTQLFCPNCHSFSYQHQDHGWIFYGANIGNGQCQICSHSLCTYCSNNKYQCQSCQLIVSNKSLGLKYYQNGVITCDWCQVIGCIRCEKNASQCTWCNEQDNGQFYGVSIQSNRTECKKCVYPCNQCKGYDNKICQNCVDSYYFSGKQCLPCIQDCLICTSYPICQTCNNSKIYHDTLEKCYNQLAFCQTYIYDKIRNVVQCSICNQYYEIIKIPQNVSYIVNCSQICGDSNRIYLPCDNQLGIEHDGCNDKCQISDEFECQDSPQNMSICSYKGVLNFTIQKIKPGTENWFQLTISVDIGLHVLKISNLSKVFFISSESDKILKVIDVYKFDESKNEITLKIEYYQDLIDFDFTILFQPNKTVNQRFYATPESNVTLNIEKIVFYSDFAFNASKFVNILCYVIVSFGWIGIVAGLVVKRVAGIETMIVFQIAYFSMIWLQSTMYTPFSQTSPLQYLIFPSITILATAPQSTIPSESSTNTLSIGLSEQPPHLSTFDITDYQFANNFNLCIILQLLALLIVLITSIVVRDYQKKIKESLIGTLGVPYFDSQGKSEFAILKQKSSIYQNTKELSCQFLVCFGVINIPNFIKSIFLLINQSPDTLLKEQNIALISISGAIYIVIIILICYNPDSFDYFRYSFKKQPLAMIHFCIFNVVFISCICLIIFVPDIVWASMVPFGLLFVYVLFYKPFEVNYENYHSAFTCLVALAILSFPVFLKYYNGNINSVEGYVYLLSMEGLMILLGLTTLISLIYRVKYVRQKAEEKIEQQLNQEKVINELNNTNLIEQSKQINDVNNVFKRLINSDMSVLQFSNRINNKINKNEISTINKNEHKVEQFNDVNKMKSFWKEDLDSGRKLRRDVDQERLTKKSKNEDVSPRNCYDNDLYERQDENNKYEQKIEKKIDKNINEYMKVKQEVGQSNPQMTQEQINQRNRRFYALQLAVEQNDFLQMKNVEHYAIDNILGRNKNEENFMNAYDQIQ